MAEVKKLYNIALNGSADERTAATRILCAASLSRGWNIQVCVFVEIMCNEIFISPACNVLITNSVCRCTKF